MRAYDLLPVIDSETHRAIPGSTATRKRPYSDSKPQDFEVT